MTLEEAIKQHTPLTARIKDPFDGEQVVIFAAHVFVMPEGVLWVTPGWQHDPGRPYHYEVGPIKQQTDPPGWEVGNVVFESLQEGGPGDAAYQIWLRYLEADGNEFDTREDALRMAKAYYDLN